MSASLPAAEIARVLVEALPYIRQFAGKSVVVKLGPSAPCNMVRNLTMRKVRPCRPTRACV